MMCSRILKVFSAGRLYRRGFAVLLAVGLVTVTLHLFSHLDGSHPWQVHQGMHTLSDPEWMPQPSSSSADEELSLDASACERNCSSPREFSKDEIFLFFQPHDVSSESWSLLTEFRQRADIAHQACRKHPTKGRLKGIFTHNASRVAYCFVPKVGCTFWIRVFSFLHNYTGDADRLKSPWEIPRLQVHNHPYAHGFSWASVKDSAKNYLRFMFVRDPFSRLWSAYLDKLFLPDFWKEIGVPAVKNIRGSNATKQALSCGNDVTFPEFVNYSLTSSEPHYDPIYLQCDPCQYQPTVIGYMDTFAQDSLFLLRRMDMEWVLKDVDRHEQEENELKTLIDYNYQRVSSRSFYRPCITEKRLAELLWEAFQYNGYIPRNIQYESPEGTFSKKEFKKKVLKAFRESSSKKAELKEQKKALMREAFRSLPKALVDKVEKKYAPDMRYFGFSRLQFG